MRVAVVGAGIGGLVLANALNQMGVQVQVHERAAANAPIEGYRLHLDATACDVLRRRLAAPVFQALLASSAGAAAFRQFSVLDHRLRPLLRIPHSSAEVDLLIGRAPLRTLLMSDVSELVRFEADYVRHELDSDGTVTAWFADGSRTTADLLVGADGTGSRVVRAMAGRDLVRRLPISAIAGRKPLDSLTRQLLPPELLTGPAFVIGPRGSGMFLSVSDPATTDLDPQSCRQIPAVTEPSYLLWSIATASSDLPTQASPRLDHALDEIREWSPFLRAAVRASDPTTVGAFPFITADPAAELTPWPAGVVTALGDAVHPMPPTGGQGAATAIRDADLLADHLRTVLDGSATIPVAVHGFQREMPGYARTAIRESLQPLRWRQLCKAPAGYALARVGLPAADALSRVGRRMRGD